MKNVGLSNVAGERSYGPYSSVTKVRVVPEKAVLKKVTSGSKKATIVWKKSIWEF